MQTVLISMHSVWIITRLYAEWCIHTRAVFRLMHSLTNTFCYVWTSNLRINIKKLANAFACVQSRYLCIFPHTAALSCIHHAYISRLFAKAYIQPCRRAYCMPLCQNLPCPRIQRLTFCICPIIMHMNWRYLKFLTPKMINKHDWTFSPFLKPVLTAICLGIAGAVVITIVVCCRLFNYLDQRERNNQVQNDREFHLSSFVNI